MIQKLIKKARERISKQDSSHDFGHALRVLANAEYIASIEGGDLEVIIPAALFHDVVIYPKNDPLSKLAATESAQVAKEILETLDYPSEKIPLVMQAIEEHSYSNGIQPALLESRIIQDADRLEITGAIAIMRTFSSTGQMQRRFYDLEDPFCKQRLPGSKVSAIDFFYTRLMKVNFHTSAAKRLAKKRTPFLHQFLKQLQKELTEVQES